MKDQQKAADLMGGLFVVVFFFLYLKSFIKDGFRKDMPVKRPRISPFYIQIYFDLFVK